MHGSSTADSKNMYLQRYMPLCCDFSEDPQDHVSSLDR